MAELQALQAVIFPHAATAEAEGTEAKRAPKINDPIMISLLAWPKSTFLIIFYFLFGKP
ncbi:MAG: hypothetical protein H7222_15815 [Methylotenera sp.]|nr:hypothetical protein [Oligoflexia bacterium]